LVSFERGDFALSPHIKTFFNMSQEDKTLGSYHNYSKYLVNNSFYAGVVD
jgi:hypothetical protein